MENKNKIKYLNIFLLCALGCLLVYYFLIFREKEIKESILRSQYIELDLDSYKQKKRFKNLDTHDNADKEGIKAKKREENDSKVDANQKIKTKEGDIGDIMDKTEEGTNEADSPKKENNDEKK